MRRPAEKVFSELVFAAYLDSQVQRLGSGILRVERARSYPVDSPIRAGFRIAAMRLPSFLHPSVDSLSDGEVIALTRAPIRYTGMEDLPVLTQVVRSDTSIIRAEGTRLIKQTVLHHIASELAIEEYNNERFAPLVLTALPQRSGYEPALPTQDRFSGAEPRLPEARIELIFLKQLSEGSLAEKMQAVEWMVLNGSQDGLLEMRVILDRLHEAKYQ